MACASQSALDYVRSARDHLVRTLKGFTEIVENLSTRGFFSEEDVNKIKSESDGFDKTRRIVDYVIEMGEEACYEFLRIIDTTRRTSGERSLSFAEYPESSSSLSNMFDLNYWISCFSFREDTNMDVQGPSPCHRYQQKLKSEAQKISERSWTQSKAVLFNKQSSLSYTSLVLDTPGQASPSKIKKSKIKKSRKLRPKKLKTYIPEDKHGTSPSELLKTYERKIILVGKPGTGKTAVVHQMLKLWSEKDNKDLDYMFYFDMREAPNITEVHKLEDLLFSVFCEPDEGNDEVLEDIKDNADSVTIIFDGVTDVGSTSVVFKLIQKTLLPEAKIIITCRPEVESADFLLDWDCLRVEVKGFSEQGIREYLSKNLSENHLNKVLCNLELFSLCHVPMYALMVVACFSFEGSDFSPHPCTVTEIYLNILHFCNQRNVSKTPENESTKWDAILSLSQAAFCATEGKNVSLTSLPKLDSCANLAILSRNVIQISPTVKKPLCAFLHYTVQEFFAALWVLKDPEKTRCVLQQCLVQGSKHMKHLVPFLCGLLNEKNTDLLEGLLPPQQLRDTSGWFFKHLVTTFVGCSDSEDCEVDLMFLCQCLYESQSPDACLCLLDKLDYCIDASGETLDPQQCCVLAYVISQSKERKIELNLEDTTVSKQGMRPLLGCLSKLQRSDSLSRQLWTISLLTDGDVDYVSLLDFTENQLHLPVNSETQLYDRAVRVLQKRKRKVKVCLHCDHRVCQSASSFLLHHLPHIHSLSFCQSSGNLSDQTELLMNLFIVAADREQRTGEKILNMLSSVCSYQTFPLHSHYNDKYQSDFLLDLCSHVKDYETKTGLSVLPSLQPVFQSAPAVWSIDLSERKTSILLELLKLQPEKKQVELRGCSHEESEVRSLLQCLPFISQLRVDAETSDEDRTRIFVSLFCAAAEREQQTGEKILELLASVCTYQTFPLHERHMEKHYQSDFLLDLCSHVKDCETKTGLSVLPSLQPVFQSAPAVWSIKLSERKTSILLELLKLQPEKKQVELRGCSHEESEVRSLLQCLPFISQLSLFCAAAEREQQTGEKILELLASVCTYQTFPLHERHMDEDDLKRDQRDFLLDLYSHVKDYETKTGLSVLPSLQPVFQSAPAVWSIDLSERKTSILLELLKLQPEKKQVELRGCSHEESEVRSLLQCLPFISQLSVDVWNRHEAVRIFVSLFCAAAEREQQTGEKILELLASVCTYQTFPLHERRMDEDDDDDYLKQYQSDFLLDLCSHVKDCETKTGLSVLPSLQPVFQSAPAVWSIDLSERKTSILLELLKLQPEKKQVELTGCSHEESEVRRLLQCLPFISQLSLDVLNRHEAVRIFVSLFCAAAEREQQTGEKILELLASVCTYQTFPLHESYFYDDDDQINFLLDLCSHVKDCETKTGLSVLPSLQPVFQSAPAVWSIDLSERKTSILLELLKLQPEKKQVELRGCSHEESEVRSLLQCLPFISQLSVDVWNRHEAVMFFVSLFCAAAEREQQTGEKILELLASVCTYQTFPLHERYMDDDDDDLKQYQSDFLLDLCSHVKDCETKTGVSVLPSLQPVFQSAPAVWSINLSERKTSILLELLKLQPEKKQVELRGCSHEESEVRSLLQCLPFISQLRVDAETSDEDRTRIFVSLFCAAAEREQQTGEKILEPLASVCTYKNSPLKQKWCDFLLDLYSYETETGLSVLPSLQPVFQSAPAVWSIDLSERKTSILLELLKLQPEKKQVELIGGSHEESEVRSLLQCLPFISQLSVLPLRSLHEAVRFFVSLFCAAAEREQQTGEKILELLASVCTYQTFPLHERYFYDDLKQYQRDFLLDLYSHVKDCETKTGLSVLPSLQSVFQSAPAVWSINLSERKTSILLELLKLQPEKKQVELRGCSHEESEVRSLLQCLPFISQLSCDPEFFQSVCTSMSVRSREEAQQLESLLQLLGFQLLLTGALHRKSCWSVGRVLKLCGSKVDLILTPSKMSARGGALLFRHTTQLHSLRLSIDMSLLLSQWVRRGRAARRLAVEELSLVPKKARPSHRVLLRAVSSLASLLRYWTVGRLDLTETCIPAQGLIALLLHHGPLTVKLSEESFQQLLSLLHETQDKDLTLSFLSKVGGDLTSCCLSWELLHYLLQQPSAQTITVDLRKNLFLQEETTRLLPFLDRIVFKRPSPSFVMSSIRELYRAHDSHAVPSLLRSLGHVISLSCRQLDSVDCAALIFILRHGDGVRLNLLWTSIPAGGVESILLMLDSVSRLSVDRNQLLRFIHCCAACDVQQEAASGLLRTLQHSLDLSCSSCVELPEEDQTEPLSLTADDCRAVSTILTQGSRDTQLDLRDCEVEDSVLDLLFPVLHRVRLRVSNTVLLQLLSLVPVNSERDAVRRAVSLCTALGGELDLSHSTLDQRVCGALVQMLDSCEGLTELDLSHCQLTDQLLLPLITHLHKVQVLDLSHNQITDASTDVLLQLLSINPSIHCVRLFSNNIVHRAAFKEHTQFEIW
ncbi:uncharacterized protein LOC113019567 isoform X4 [Astatotilapia calliptera]|uniref:uncharacterized protein LOC113019567 isoform X4 n=1 Tax=Astatotilapia calliptera TaxID=8154 RepID=UPI000E41A6C8|nr:uncharacterized protein LOC113019567 isoform X4 [Astatotilapia calliptera]